jgi:hypothetical protein
VNRTGASFVPRCARGADGPSRRYTPDSLTKTLGICDRRSSHPRCAVHLDGRKIHAACRGSRAACAVLRRAEGVFGRGVSPRGSRGDLCLTIPSRDWHRGTFVTFGGSCSCFAGPDLRIGREGRHDTTSACKSCTFFDSSSSNGEAKVENGGLCR